MSAFAGMTEFRTFCEFVNFEHWDFDIVSDFVFRISDFSDDFKALSFRTGSQFLVPSGPG
jgi:hypothetical protein